MTLEIDMDRVVMAAVTVGVMFASMRLLYGYWPWQPRNQQGYKRGYAAGAADVAYARETSEDRINASDFPYTDPPMLSVATDEDHFERPATGDAPITTPPGDQPVPEENK